MKYLFLSFILFLFNNNSSSEITYNSDNYKTVYNSEIITETNIKSEPYNTPLCCNTTSFAWTGVTNSNWSNSSNWYGGNVPTSSDDVVIPSSCVTNWPILDANSNCKNLTVESGAQLSCSSYNLYVYGNWVNNGTFNAGTGNVYFMGSTNTTITYVGASETILSEGFETGTSGWTLGSQTNHTEWRRQAGGYSGSYDCASYDLYNSVSHSYYNASTQTYVDLSRNIDLSDYSSASIIYYWKCNSSSTNVKNIFSFAE